MWQTLNKTNLNSIETLARIHFEHPLAVSLFQTGLNDSLTQLYDASSELIILCIGTDRSTGDSLGPFCGSRLLELGFDSSRIYGTLDQPVHAVNLEETLATIRRNCDNPFIIAIDACLGRSENIGYINIKEGPLQPGTGVKKELPSVGDLHIIGVVNVGGMMEYMVLQNTRLNLVVKMADIISRGLFHSLYNKSAFHFPTQPLFSTSKQLIPETTG